MDSSEATPVASSRDVFPFLSLPAELRNNVYRRLLIRGSDAEAACHTGVMRTCQQVNRETTPMLYAENVVRIFATRPGVLLFSVPISATACPLHRIVKLEVNMRILFDFWDYEELNPRTVRENIMWFCRDLAKHAHAIKELTLKIRWGFPRSFGPSYDDPQMEETILSQFSMLRNIPTVNIEASTSDAFNQSLRDGMARPR